MLFRMEDVVVRYGRAAALRGVTMEVPRDRVVAVIGANGAGKTTALRAASGLEKISGGALWLDDARIDSLPPEEIVSRGVAHVPEGRRVFPDLTAEENLRVGAFLRRDSDGIESDLRDIFRRFPRLEERRKQWAKTMSGGEQQMLAIGRALMSRPRLLLLDEPSVGLSPVMTMEITRIIRDIRAREVPVVLVEQNAELALRLADYAYVLETGKVALEGDAEELRGNDHVRKAYLGG